MKWAQSNLGKYGNIRPLNNLHKMPFKSLAATNPAELAKWQGRRIHDDLLEFIPARYPESRNIVLATAFLTLGARYAKRAGVDGNEIALFVGEEQEKCV